MSFIKISDNKIINALQIHTIEHQDDQITIIMADAPRRFPDQGNGHNNTYSITLKEFNRISHQMHIIDLSVKCKPNENEVQCKDCEVIDLRGEGRIAPDGWYLVGREDRLQAARHIKDDSRCEWLCPECSSNYEKYYD